MSCEVFYMFQVVSFNLFCMVLIYRVATIHNKCKLLILTNPANPQVQYNVPTVAVWVQCASIIVISVHLYYWGQLFTVFVYVFVVVTSNKYSLQQLELNYCQDCKSLPPYVDLNYTPVCVLRTSVDRSEIKLVLDQISEFWAGACSWRQNGAFNSI